MHYFREFGRCYIDFAVKCHMWGLGLRFDTRRGCTYVRVGLLCVWITLGRHTT